MYFALLRSIRFIPVNNRLTSIDPCLITVIKRFPTMAFRGAGVDPPTRRARVRDDRRRFGRSEAPTIQIIADWRQPTGHPTGRTLHSLCAIDYGSSGCRYDAKGE
jgi:hypothetical protein